MNEGLLLNECKIDAQTDGVKLFQFSTEKHYNILSISTTYINVVNISLITYISKINLPNDKKIINFISKGLNSKKVFIEVSLIPYVTIISMLLIIISNYSLLNPGPDSISVYYQNIHGLLAFSSLGIK